MIVERFQAPCALLAGLVVGRVGQHLQREVMIAHHELVAGQGIERVAQLLGLGDREVPGVDHAVELPLQQRLPRAFASES